MQEMILILDFGSQYTQLIARRVRELNVYCEIHPYNKIPKIGERVKGVILSGSPHSTLEEGAPAPDLSEIKGKIPTLGVCYGAQYLALNYGGSVEPSKIREYGRANLEFIDERSSLFAHVPHGSQVWMSHGDTITNLPENYRIIASTADVNVAGYKIEGEDTWGIQFHPEVYHTTEGRQLLENFVSILCGCAQNWTPDSFVESTVTDIINTYENDDI